MNLPYPLIRPNSPNSASNDVTIFARGHSWLMSPTRSPELPLRIARHFLDRLHERFPQLALTEGSLARELRAADWYPAGGRAFYAVRRLGGEVAVLVVEVQDGLLDLVTIYPPKRGWDSRLANARPWPFALVALACSA